MTVRIITQCRMTSSRLPGKILMPLGSETVLAHHLIRLKKSGLPVCMACTSNAVDDALVEIAKQYEVDIVRGSETDVLQRFADAIERYPADWIVRVTSDCPFIDPDLIMQGVALLNQFQTCDAYVSNCFPRTYARGFDFEIFHSSLILEALQQSNDAYDHEHVTPYLWQNKNGRMQLHNVAQSPDESQWRLCIDTPEDYELCQYLETHFGASQLSYHQIHALMHAHPALGQINAHIEQKK
jgi:spore coat polysaccharide biosynthesis protein SpsF